MVFRFLTPIVAAAFTTIPLLLTANAQAPTKPEMRESCPGLIAAQPPRVTPVSLRLALAAQEVRLTYAGHSTFLIESPRSVRIATDYNDYVQVPLPTIATMNRAHDTHFSGHPSPV